MVRIRLRRVGLKKQPSYRIVVTDQRSPRDGDFIEIVGHYNPRTRPSTDEVNEARVLYWLSVGAQPTDSVATILRRTGTLDRFARLRTGESLEALVAEAEGARAPAARVSPRRRHRHPGPGGGRQEPQEEQADVASGDVVVPGACVMRLGGSITWHSPANGGVPWRS